jgi:4-alpha-glucanotransferase
MGLFAYHDSQNFFYRSPFGAVTCGQTIIFRLEICSTKPVEDCVLRLWESERERLILMYPKSAPQEQKVIFETEYKVPNKPGLVWYYFIISFEGHNYYYGNNANKLGGEGTLEDKEPSSYQVTVYYPMNIPTWYRQGIMYQIYVDRFYHVREDKVFPYPRKNFLLHVNWYDSPCYIKDETGRVTHWDFFGGNLLGVIKKLPHLQELGISIIYLNPIFEATSNHKYDTADYQSIDPMYGDEELFERLIIEAKQYGIAIMLDGVFSHTGSDSVYFNRYHTYPCLGAYQSSESPYYSWYQFKPNSKEYKSWWNVDALPEVDELNPSFQEFILGAENGVIQKWMKKGISGWRLDVADELPDEFIRKLRQTVKTINPEAILIGEVWEDASNKQSYGKLREYFWGYELDATMNYPFREVFLHFMLGKINSGLAHQRIMSLYENYPRENFYGAMNLIGSHDRERILTLLGEAPPEQSMPETQKRTYKLSPEARQLALQRLKLISLIQMTFPGVPCVYYGDEVGLEGYSDPYNRGTYPWGLEDNIILDWYKKIIRLRQEYEVLQSGDFSSFYAEPDVYGFSRSWGDEKITVLLNRHTEQERNVKYSLCVKDSIVEYPFVIELLNGKILTGQTTQLLKLAPLSARLFLSKQSQSSFPHQDFHRSCGVLMHISSLASDTESGDLGIGAYRFIDFLVDSGQSLWQVLPLNPVGLGDSPYQSDSAFAGNLRLINLDFLVRVGLIQTEYLKTISQTSLSLEKVKEVCLREAFKPFRVRMADRGSEGNGLGAQFLSRLNYERFLMDNREWIKDYALYRALKVHFGNIPWYNWEEEIAYRKTEKLEEYSKLLEEEVEFNRFVQYTFYFQWQELRQYATAKHIKLIGDIPLFVAGDSCDVWVNRQFFKLNEKGRPIKVAGVPPDYFSATGQLWGNPVYDWDALESEDYSWWKQRIKLVLKLFDYIRLDHFRGFEAYWEIDAEEDTAVNGRWIKGPGKRFFENLALEFGKLPFIAEDLGIITTEVNVLKYILGFPGMKVLQFTPLKDAFVEGDMNMVLYSGTHDNDTLVGWYKSTILSGEDCGHEQEEQMVRIKGACNRLIEDLYMSRATWVITPMQDILGLDSEARMNVPGTISGNWQWTLNKELLTAKVKKWLYSLAKDSNRLP